MSSTELLRVLYDPAGWADPEWCARYGVDICWPRRLANRILLRSAGLPQVGGMDCDDARVAWLTSEWRHLPAIAYIAGARIARDTLLARNALTRLQYNAYQFVTLPMPLLAAALSTGQGRLPSLDGFGAHSLVMLHGAACLQAATRGLADAWQQRIRLRLPPSADDADDGAYALGPQSALKLLKFAAHFYHAQNH